MVDIVDKALRMGEGRQIKKLEHVAQATDALEDEIAALNDEELKGQTAKFKQRLDNGESLDKLMPEAFATVREASKRTLGLRHFDVQLMGGAALRASNPIRTNSTISLRRLRRLWHARSSAMAKARAMTSVSR